MILRVVPSSNVSIISITDIFYFIIFLARSCITLLCSTMTSHDRQPWSVSGSVWRLISKVSAVDFATLHLHTSGGFLHKFVLIYNLRLLEPINVIVMLYQTSNHEFDMFNVVDIRWCSMFTIQAILDHLWLPYN